MDRPNEYEDKDNVLENYRKEPLRNSPWGDLSDSGHFTVSPDVVENVVLSSLSGYSGSSSSNSRGHSPILGHSATLVRKACGTLPYSQVNTYAYSNENSQRSDGSSVSVMSLHSCPGGDDENAISSASKEDDEENSSVNYLKTALDNFNSLYQEKLKMVEDIGAQGDSDAQHIMMQKKTEILECWAKDVCVQNMVLIQTVEELEKQGDEKLKMLQQKINESSVLMKSHKRAVDLYEDKIKSLQKEHTVSEELNKSLQLELDKTKQEYKSVRGRINQLEKENDSLLTLITRIRDMGVWDLSGLEFNKRTFSQMFELYPHLPGSEVQTVFTRERARAIRETEDHVEMLQEKVTKLERQQYETNSILSIKDGKISELGTEIKKMSNQLKHCQEECEHYKRSLIETQEKLLQISTKLPSRPQTPEADNLARHAEIQELLQELRSVKSQLYNSVQENQNSKEETNKIRREFSERLRAMQESQQCLHSGFSLKENQHSVQEKQLELEKLKDEMEKYRNKCENSDKQLGRKDQIIEELQQTVKQLNSKKKSFGKESISGHCDMIGALNSTFLPTVLKCCRENQFIKPDHKEKPIWNEHFVKSGFLNNSTASSGNFSPLINNNDANNVSRKVESKVNHSQDCQKLKNRFPLCSCADLEIDLNADSSLNSTFNTLLPKLDTKIVERHNPNSVDSKKMKSSPDKCPKKHNDSYSADSTYEMLMGVAVEASKKLFKSSDMTSNKRLTSIKVVAGRRKRKGDAGDVSKIEEHLKTRAPESQLLMTSNKAVKDCCNSNVTEKQIDNSDKSRNPIPHISKSLEELLCELPDHSYINVVQEWIHHKTPADCGNSKFSTRNKLDKSSVNKQHHCINKDDEKKLARLAAEKKALQTSSKIYAEKTRQIEKDISDIKEEWNRVFQKTESPYLCSKKEPNFLHEMEDLSVAADNLTTQTSSGNFPSVKMEPNPANSSSDSTAAETIERLQHEKLELQEEFKSTMKQKDIEITMQKNETSKGNFWDVADAYNKFKAEATVVLKELTSDNISLLEKANRLKEKMNFVNELIKDAECKQQQQTPQTISGKTLTELWENVQKLSVNCFENSTKLDDIAQLAKDIGSLSKEAESEVGFVHQQLSLLQSICEKQQEEIASGIIEIKQLEEEKTALRLQRELIKEELSAMKIKIQKKKEASELKEYSAINKVLKDLETLKCSFDKSEESNKKKDAELVRMNALLKKYEEYTKKFQNFIENQASLQIQLDEEKAKNRLLTIELDTISLEKDEMRINEVVKEAKVSRLEEENAELKHKINWYIGQVDIAYRDMQEDVLHRIPGRNDSGSSESNHFNTDLGAGDANIRPKSAMPLLPQRVLPKQFHNLSLNIRTNEKTNDLRK